jgi:endoglucanase
LTRRLFTPLALLVLAGCLGAGPAAANPSVGASDPSPIAGAPLYVDRFEQPSYRAYRAALREGRMSDARNLFKIARHPIFRWIGKTDENPERAARNFLAKVRREQPGAVPGITVLNHVGEKCGGGYHGGGRRENGRYRRWMARFARGVGNARVIIGFEPDSLGTLKCLRSSARRARLRNMKSGIRLLSRLPKATVYIDGTASDWRPAREVARYLRYVGISRVRGFMLNATHVDFTSRNVRYGQRLSRMLGGKHFVINTDENGNGPLRYRRYTGPGRFRSVHVFCNPRNSALGHPPTTTVDAAGRPLPAKVDGYLWISRPAASGGSCRQFPARYAMRGGGKAGKFFLRRALMLARRSRYE